MFKVQTVFLHPFLQRFFSPMPERRMAKVVRKRDAFGNIFIHSQHPCDVPCYLCNFECMCQSCSEVISFSCNKDLCLSLQPTECSRMENPIAVALKWRPERIIDFLKTSAECSLMWNGTRVEQRIRL